MATLEEYAKYLDKQNEAQSGNSELSALPRRFNTPDSLVRTPSEFTVDDIIRLRQEQAIDDQRKVQESNIAKAAEYAENKPGAFQSTAQGLAAGLTQTAQSVGTGLEYTGGKLGIKPIKELGTETSRFWREAGKKYEAPKELQGSLVEHPELLKSGAWWGYNVAQMLPSFAVALVPGVAATKYIKVASKLLKFTPEVYNRLATLGAMGLSGAVGGGLEGTSTYQEILQRGGSEEDARSAMEQMTLASGALNTLSFGKVLQKMPVGSKFKKAALHYLSTGAVESLTEWMEEPAEGVIKLNLGYMTPEEVKQQMAQGVNVIPPAFIMGMLGAGGVQYGGGGGVGGINADNVTQIPDDELQKSYESRVKNLNAYRRLLGKQKESGKKITDKTKLDLLDRVEIVKSIKSEIDRRETLKQEGVSPLVNVKTGEVIAENVNVPIKPQTAEEIEAGIKPVVSKIRKHIAPAPEEIETELLPPSPVEEITPTGIANITPTETPFTEAIPIKPKTNEINTEVTPNYIKVPTNNVKDIINLMAESDKFETGFDVYAFKNGGMVNVERISRYGNKIVVHALKGVKEFSVPLSYFDYFEAHIEPKQKLLESTPTELPPVPIESAKAMAVQKKVEKQKVAPVVPIVPEVIKPSSAIEEARSRIGKKAEVEVAPAVAGEGITAVEKAKIRASIRKTYNSKGLGYAKQYYYHDTPGDIYGRSVIAEFEANKIKKIAKIKREGKPMNPFEKEQFAQHVEWAEQHMTEMGFTDEEKEIIKSRNYDPSAIDSVEESIRKAESDGEGEGEREFTQEVEGIDGATPELIDEVIKSEPRGGYAKAGGTEDAFLGTRAPGDKWRVEQPTAPVPPIAQKPTQITPAIEPTGEEIVSAKPPISTKEVVPKNVPYQIYTSKDKTGADIWLVPSRERKTGQGFGDTIHRSEADAQKMVESNIRQDEADIRRFAEIEQQEKEKAEAKIVKDNTDGFADSLPPLQRGKAIATLNAKMNFSGKPMSVKDKVKELVDSGEAKPESYQEDKIKPMSRTAFNRATQREQDAHDKKVKESGKVTRYTVGGYELGKIAYDYTNHLIAIKESKNRQVVAKKEEVATKGLTYSVTNLNNGESWEGIAENAEEAYKHININKGDTTNIIYGRQSSAKEWKKDQLKSEVVTKGTEPDEIFIRPLKTAQERANPSSTKNMSKISAKEGYEVGYKPYGAEGKGYYYIKKDMGDIEITPMSVNKSGKEFDNDKDMIALAEKVQGAVEFKSIQDVVNYIADNYKGEKKLVAQKVAEQIKRLEDAGVIFNFKVAHIGHTIPNDLKMARGMVESQFRDGKWRVNVWVNGSDVIGRVGVYNFVVLHELIHAATNIALRIGKYSGEMRGRKFAKDIRDLDLVTNAIRAYYNKRIEDFDAGKIKLTDMEDELRMGIGNQLTSSNEILAYALSSREFQSYLESIPYRGVTLWTKFVRAIRTFLGLSETADTALSEVLRVSESILDTDPNKFIGVNTINGKNRTAQEIDTHSIETFPGMGEPDSFNDINKPEVSLYSAESDLDKEMQDALDYLDNIEKKGTSEEKKIAEKKDNIEVISNIPGFTSELVDNEGKKELHITGEFNNAQRDILLKYSGTKTTNTPEGYDSWLFVTSKDGKHAPNIGTQKIIEKELLQSEGKPIDRIIKQSEEVVKQDRPGISKTFMQKIPILKQILQYERPSLELVGENEKIQVSYVANQEARTDVAIRQLITRIPLIKQLDDAFGKDIVRGKTKSDIEFLGKPEETESLLTGTLLDIVQNADLYELDEAQQSAIDAINKHNNASLEYVNTGYGTDIGHFKTKPGSAFLSNVDISEDVIDALGSESRAIKSGRGKTRIWDTARDRQSHDKTFEPELNIERLINGMDGFKASAAGGVVARQILGGKTRLEAMEETHPKLYNKMMGLRKRLQSLQGMVKRLNDSLKDKIDNIGEDFQHEIGLYLDSPHEISDITRIQDTLDVKISRGKNAGLNTDDIQNEIDEVRAEIKGLKPVWEVANLKPYVFVQNGIYRYFPAKQAALIKKQMKISDNKFIRLMQNWKATAFGGDFSPILGVQTPIGVLADPIGSFLVGKRGISRMITERNILRPFQLEELVKDISEDTDSWIKYFTLTGRVPVGTPEEFAGGFLSKIPGYNAFTEGTYTFVTRQSKYLFDKISKELITDGVPELEANVTAINAANEIYPLLSTTKLGQSQARAALLQSVPTSYSFIRQPASMIASGLRGYVKLGMPKAKLTPKERVAVRLMTTMAISVLSTAAISAFISAAGDDRDKMKAVWNAVNPSPYNGNFASIIIGKHRVPLGGPYRAIFRAMFPQKVSGIPIPIPFAGLFNFTRNRINPLAGTQIDLIKNRDYYGQQILRGDFPEKLLRFLEYELEGVMPLTLGTVAESVRKGETGSEMRWQTIGQFVGTNVAKTSNIGLLRSQWKKDFKKYNEIPADPDEARSKKMVNRSIYRRIHSDVDAKLFITGQVGTVSTSRAAAIAFKLIQENKIEYDMIKGIKSNKKERDKQRKLGVSTGKRTYTDALTDKLNKQQK